MMAYEPLSQAKAPARAAAARPAHRPLRILAALNALAPLGGVEMCVLQDGLGLVGRGHQLDIAYGADGPLRPAFAAAGVGLSGPYRFAFRPRRAPLDLARFAGSARWAHAQRPDVVWLNRFEHIAWAQVMARSAGCPLVAHLHGPPMFRRVRQIGAGVARFVAVSEFVRQAWISAGADPARVSVVANAVQPSDYPIGGVAERAAARRCLGLPAEVPIVLCYGQLTEQKGLLVLIEAWRSVLGRHPSAVLVLLNSASPNVDQSVSAALAGLDPSSYRVFATTCNVVPYLHACDVVAFPSLLPEAFGRVVIEGLSTGRPVVASRVGAVPEILRGPFARYLVEPGRAPELAAVLTGALTWRDHEPRLAEACAHWPASRFRYEDHLDAVEAIIVESAFGHGGRRADASSHRRPGDRP